jgi:hypothetical protein
MWRQLLWSLTVQESVRTVGPKDADMWPEGTTCFCVFWTLELEGNTFLQWTVTSDGTWVCHFTPESKRSSIEWWHERSPSPKKFKVQPSAGKPMASVFWNSEGMIHVDILPPHATVNAQYYSNLLLNDVHAEIHKKRPRNCKRESSCYTTHVHIQLIWPRHWQPWAGKSWITLFTVCIYPLIIITCLGQF